MRMCVCVLLPAPVGNCVYSCSICVMNNCARVLFLDFYVKHFEFELYLYIKLAYV